MSAPQIPSTDKLTGGIPTRLFEISPSGLGVLTAPARKNISALTRYSTSQSERPLDEYSHEELLVAEQSLGRKCRLPGHIDVYIRDNCFSPLPTALARQFVTERGARQTLRPELIRLSRESLAETARESESKEAYRNSTLAANICSTGLLNGVSEVTGIDTVGLRVGRHPDGELFATCRNIRGKGKIILLSHQAGVAVNDQLRGMTMAIDCFRNQTTTALITAFFSCLEYSRGDKSDRTVESDVAEKLYKDQLQDPRRRSHQRSAIAVPNVLSEIAYRARGGDGATNICLLDGHSPYLAGMSPVPLSDFSPIRPLFQLTGKILTGDNPICVMLPDVGEQKRFENYELDEPARLSELLRIPKNKINIGSMYKERENGKIVDIKPTNNTVVDKRDVIFVDDMFATGGTMIGAIEGAKNRGARRAIIVVTHTVGGNAGLELARSALYMNKRTGMWEYLVDAIVTTDSIPLKGPLRRLSIDGKRWEPFVAELPILPLVAEMSCRIALGNSNIETSLSDLTFRKYTDDLINYSLNLSGFKH